MKKQTKTVTLKISIDVEKGTLKTDVKKVGLSNLEVLGLLENYKHQLLTNYIKETTNGTKR
jgi:hypothetical protein